jgi:hypothetical protein
VTFVPLDRVVEVVSYAECEGGGVTIPIVNTHYVHEESADWDAANMDALLGAFDTWWGASVAPVTDSSYTLISWKCTDLSEEAGLQRTLTSGTPGTRVTNGAPACNCVHVVWPATTTGKPTKGANFHSGGGDADNTEGRWESTFVTDVAEAYSTMYTTIQAENVAYKPVCVSRYSGFTIASRANGTRYKKPTPRVTGIFNYIQDATANTKIAVHKSRRR